jgi:FkbM family methyltransferase
MSTQTLPPVADFGNLKPSPALQAALFVTRHLPGFWPGKTLASAVRHVAWPAVGEAVDVDVFSCRMRLHPHDNLCEKRVLFTPQFFDRAEREYLEARVQPGFTFIDIGANVGAYSLFVGRLCAGQGRIVAVEPDPVVFERLRYNVETNGLSIIAPVQTAVSDVSGEVELFLDGHNRGQNSLVGEGGTAVRVASMTLRDLLDAYKIDRPDCLKIDIEGAEERVFAKFCGEAPPERFPRAVILEQIRRQELTPAARLLMDHGYHIVQRTRMNLILER